jgi:8-oxo-dGTP pyrophosphatase MutT (NUDIX family)
MSYYHIGSGGRRVWGKKGAGILFTDGENVLLLKRARYGAADHVDTWGIPGGKAKEGESALATAKRETKEEAGQVQGERFAQFDEQDGHHKFVVFLFKVAKPFDVTISKEHSESQWVPFDQLKGLDLHPQFKKHLPYYMKAIKKKFPHSFQEWLAEMDWNTTPDWAQKVYDELKKRSLEQGGAWVARIVFGQVNYYQFPVPSKVPDAYLDSTVPFYKSMIGWNGELKDFSPAAKRRELKRGYGKD